jgi:hypothetical protein
MARRTANLLAAACFAGTLAVAGQAMAAEHNWKMQTE